MEGEGCAKERKNLQAGGMKILLSSYWNMFKVNVRRERENELTNDSTNQALFPAGMVHHRLLIVMESGIEKGHRLVCGERIKNPY